ncbi:MAG: hypothetical protein CFE21_14650 [Bacteroidetes bacterium B1(2017)]|nr:MAG: hypothetical protein CFE21_14650 [Bacteroidetes bacterium B1(2017)]
MKKIFLLSSILILFNLAHAQNPYPTIPIDTVQFVNDAKMSGQFPNDSSDYVNPVFKNQIFRDTFRIEGYVLFDPRLYGLPTGKNRASTVIMADTFGRPWGGVEVMADPTSSVMIPSQVTTLATLVNENHFFDNVKPGYKVRITGILRTFRNANPAGNKQGQSQMNLLRGNPNWDNSVEILDLNPKQFTATPIRIDSLMTGNASIGQVQKKLSGEKWEGSYVELKNVTVLTRTASGSRWFWSVADENGNAIDVNDFSGWFRNDNLSDSLLPVGRFTPPIIGTRISFIRGVIIENSISSQYRYVIAPLLPSDLGPVSYTPPTIVSRQRGPVVATSNDSVGVLVKVQQGSARVSTVKLFHTVGYTNTVFDTINLVRNQAPNDTTLWYGFIPKRPNGSIVKYFVRPTDVNGFFTNSPDTFGSYNAYKVTDAGIKTIQDLQFSPYPNNQTIWHNDSISGVDIRGIVTSNNMTQGTTNILTIQNGTGLNSAIIVNRVNGDITGTWKAGDSVSLTGFRVVETFGNTCLNSVAGTKISSGNALPAFTTLNIDTISTISASAARRPELCGYEGMLMKWDSVYVVNVNADAPSNFGEFLVNTNKTKTTGLRIDDISTKLPDNFNNNLVASQLMKKAQGIFILSFSNWKLEPRDSNDLDFSGAPDTEKPVITLTGKNPDSLLLNATYVEPGFTAADNKDGDITSNVVRTSGIDNTKIGTYLITYKVSDLAGNKDSVTRTVIVYSKTSINENELTYALSNVYPNPAHDQLTLSVSNINTLPLTANIIDLSGRTLLSQTFTSNTINHVFDIRNLQNGIYFCNLESANGTKTIKFVVTK